MPSVRHSTTATVKACSLNTVHFATMLKIVRKLGKQEVKPQPLTSDSKGNEHCEAGSSFSQLFHNYDSTKSMGNSTRPKMERLVTDDHTDIPAGRISYVERLAKAIDTHSKPLESPVQEKDRCSPVMVRIEDEQLAEMLWKDIFASVCVHELLQNRQKEVRDSGRPLQ